MTLINGNEFTRMGHYYLDEHIDGGGLKPQMLFENSIIFCKIDYIQKLFDFLKFSQKKYILITHNSDYPIDAFRFNSRPKSIIKWFGQNVIINHPDLINIPIGLENQTRKPPAIPIVDYSWFYDNMDLLKNNQKDTNTIYCNWNSKTNASRDHIMDALKSNNIEIEIEDKRLSHKEYCNKLSRYKYVICPRGNGVSTHRFWETLYLGSIPIVIDHRIYRDYTLPIIKLGLWKDLKNEMLNNFDKSKYQLEQLDFNYWKNLIQKEFKKL